MGYGRMKWPTFVLDIANNHGGSVSAGIDIINQFAEVANAASIPTVIKFQFRDCKRFQHGDSGYQPRFKECALGDEDMAKLISEVRTNGLGVAGTAFDPASTKWLDLCDYAKIASCSAKDTETLAAITDKQLPTIVSTGGLSLQEAADLADKTRAGAILHCVSLYPTPVGKSAMWRISWLRRRFPGLTIGWSSHCVSLTPLVMAVALGAEMFEYHIGLSPPFNLYSLTTIGFATAIETYKQASEALSSTDTTEEQLTALARVERKYAA